MGRGKGLFSDFTGNCWFLVFSYSIGCIDEGRTPIAKHLRTVAVGTLTGSVSEAPFEYEYHFIEYEYEYDQEQTSIATRIPEQQRTFVRELRIELVMHSSVYLGIQYLVSGNPPVFHGGFNHGP